MTLVFCMKKKLSYLTFLKVMYVKKGINFRHDIYSVEMNTANIYCRRCKYQLCITYNFFPHTLKIVWCNFKREQKVLYGLHTKYKTVGEVVIERFSKTCNFNVKKQMSSLVFFAFVKSSSSSCYVFFKNTSLYSIQEFKKKDGKRMQLYIFQKKLCAYFFALLDLPIVSPPLIYYHEFKYILAKISIMLDFFKTNINAFSFSYKLFRKDIIFYFRTFLPWNYSKVICTSIWI